MMFEFHKSINCPARAAVACAAGSAFDSWTVCCCRGY
jgi:hypothetical protein